MIWLNKAERSYLKIFKLTVETWKAEWMLTVYNTVLLSPVFTNAGFMENSNCRTAEGLLWSWTLLGAGQEEDSNYGGRWKVWSDPSILSSWRGLIKNIDEWNVMANLTMSVKPWIKHQIRWLTESLFQYRKSSLFMRTYYLVVINHIISML